jgi:hypothetical protein
MESKLEVLILVLVLSSLLVIYSGNDKSSVGKKLKIIGYQLLASASILLGSLYTFNDFSIAQDILFYIGSFMCVAAIFQLSHTIKKLALKSA